MGELLDVIGTALGGEMVTTTVEGRERFGVTVRYPRELRSNPGQIEREVLVPIMGGAMVPLGQVAKVKQWQLRHTPIQDNTAPTLGVPTTSIPTTATS